MTTERFSADERSESSKKLPTIEGFTPGPWLIAVGHIRCEVQTCPGQIYAFTPKGAPNARLIAAAPDLYRIAHEQREVIRDLAWGLEAYLSYELHGKRGGTRAFTKANAEKLKAYLAAAAPFLSEE